MLRRPCRPVAPSSPNPPLTVASYSRELVLANDEYWLVRLEAEQLWLNERNWLAVDADETLALLDVSDGRGRLLLAEALNGLRHLRRGKAE